MTTDREAPAPLSRPLAVAYLVGVALVWLANIRALLAAVTAGSASPAQFPGGAVVAFIVVYGAVLLVAWQVHLRLGGATTRLVGVVFGSAVSTAWRCVRA
jgi:hypothetical protein